MFVHTEGTGMLQVLAHIEGMLQWLVHRGYAARGGTHRARRYVTGGAHRGRFAEGCMQQVVAPIECEGIRWWCP